MSDGNFFDGAAHTVFQGRDVYGGVHFHQQARPVVPPLQVLEPAALPQQRGPAG
ncbi:hypothetical protein GCM10022222_18780 [Amycolatopsis ultiminotia]|uniref:Uncharacterized protein n=1 Tax=Amycolatopsis ultiminotia TaxID=543629 RepID=A0ABP6VGI6_9PSEU